MAYMYVQNRQLRARTAQSTFKRWSVENQKGDIAVTMAIAPSWFSTEYL